MCVYLLYIKFAYSFPLQVPNSITVPARGCSPGPAGLHVAVIHWLLSLSSRNVPDALIDGSLLLSGPDEVLIGHAAGWMLVTTPIIA